MDTADILQTIAEISIGIAGFGGIAAGLGYRARGVWSTEDQVRLIAMACVSLMVVFACLVPYVIYHLGFNVPWRPAAFILLPFQAGNLAAQLRISRSGISGSYNRLAVIILLILQISALGVLLGISLGFATELHLGLYLFSVVVLLLIASILFLRLLTTSFRAG